MNTRFTFFILISLLVACKKETPSDNGRIKNETTITTSDWMHQTLMQYPTKDIALIDLAVPGSHDAGMYVLNLCTFGANSCNTQTQHLPMKQQLEAGLRIFDIRPCIANNKYFTQHATGCDGLGCKGDLLSSIFEQTNNFLNQHNELVMLRFSHFCGTSFNDTGFINLLTRTFGDKIYKETTPISGLFIQQPLKNIIPPTNTQGKVMFIFDEGISNTATNRANGYFAGSITPSQGGWTNNNNFPELKRRQLANYNNFTNDGNSIFQFSWQVTQDEPMAISCAIIPGAASIQTNADIANKALATTFDTLIMNNDIRKGRIPNVIWIDYADKFVTEQCIRINKINLQ